METRHSKALSDAACANQRPGERAKTDALIAVNGAGLQQFTDDRVEPFPIRDPTDPKRVLRDREVDSNKLSAIAMVVSGSERWRMDSSMYMMAGQTRSESRMVFQATL